MEFTIALPERFKFGDWEVCLKSLILPNKIWNLYKETMSKWKLKTSLNIAEEVQDVWFQIGEGSYEIDDIIEFIQHILDVYYVPIEITYNSERKRVNLKLKKKNLKMRDYFTLYFNGYLSKILGFSVTNLATKVDISKKKKHHRADYQPHIHAFTPKNIIVTCDIVDETIFNDQRLNLLRLVNKMDRSEDTLHYDFLQDEYIKLGTHEFDKIKIRISDVTGNLLKVKYPEIETRIQLEFKEST